MSAIACGKRSFYEDLPSTPRLSKRLRCSSTYTPIRISPPRPTTTSPSPSDANSKSTAIEAALNQLTALFPNIDKQNIWRALEEAGNDLDAAIKNLKKKGLLKGSTETSYSEDPSDPNNLSKTGPEWVELIVTEMTKSSNMDDARIRASRVLGVLEKSIRINASAQAIESSQMENKALKEQAEVLVRDNTVLKRAVAILHKHQKENDEKSLEVQQLKQLVTQYQEQVRTLEVNNYALSMHLRQAQQSSSVPSRFNPDIF